MQVIASAIAVGVIVHGGVHLACDFPRIIAADNELFERSVGNDFHHKQPDYLWFLTSIEGITGVIMVILMSISFTLATRWFRRSLIKLPWPFQNMTGFNAFWYSHHLFAVVYVLLIIHGIFLILSHGFWKKTVSCHVLCWQTDATVPIFLFTGKFCGSHSLTASPCFLFRHGCTYVCHWFCTAVSEHCDPCELDNTK